MIKTRLTEMFGLQYPIVLAPIAVAPTPVIAAGGKDVERAAALITRFCVEAAVQLSLGARLFQAGAGTSSIPAPSNVTQTA